MKQKEIDNLELMYNKLGRVCFWCGGQASERGHVIGNRIVERAKFGNDVIDSPFNWLPVCQKHNSKVNISSTSQPVFSNNHAVMVKAMNEIGYDNISREEILNYYDNLFEAMGRKKGLT